MKVASSLCFSVFYDRWCLPYKQALLEWSSTFFDRASGVGVFVDVFFVLFAHFAKQRYSLVSSWVLECLSNPEKLECTRSKIKHVIRDGAPARFDTKGTVIFSVSKC
jgi:hypothetical protein